jgi:phospholipid-transporting ATPase
MFSIKEKNLALIIDGVTLDFVFKDKEMEQKFFQFAKMCKSVICCRLAPLHKALVVKLVKESDNVQCLAIGDGANDVPMIQAAQIGRVFFFPS